MMTALIGVKASIRRHQVDTNIQQEIYALSDERKFCMNNMIDE